MFYGMPVKPPDLDGSAKNAGEVCRKRILNNQWVHRMETDIRLVRRRESDWNNPLAAEGCKP